MSHAAPLQTPDPLRVLHVEDCATHHTSVHRLLKEIYGDAIYINWEQNVANGIHSIHADEYDLIILDYILSDGTAADIMRNVDALHFPAPFIIISAFNEHEFDARALHYGADDYLIKGKFDKHDLYRSINYALYRRKKMKAIQEMAFCDHLTGIPNRHFLQQFVEKSINVSTRVGRAVGVFFLDLNDFKKINDNYGHNAGDHVLRTTAQRLQSKLRKTDTIVRMGGDEFVVVSPAMGLWNHKSILSEKICRILNAPIRFQDSIFAISASIGAASIPGDADNLENAIRFADNEMYDHKHSRPR